MSFSGPSCPVQRSSVNYALHQKRLETTDVTIDPCLGTQPVRNRGSLRTRSASSLFQSRTASEVIGKRDNKKLDNPFLENGHNSRVHATVASCSCFATSDHGKVRLTGWSLFDLLGQSFSSNFKGGSCDLAPNSLPDSTSSQNLACGTGGSRYAAYTHGKVVQMADACSPE